MSLKTLTRANFRFLDNLPISQFILNFVRPHKTKNITDTIVYVSYARKKIKRAGFMGWMGRGGVTDALYYVQQTWLAYLWRLQTLFQATFCPAPSFLFFFKFCNQDVSSMTPSLQTRSLNEAVYRVIDRLVYITACLQRWTISLLEATDL